MSSSAKKNNMADSKGGFFSKTVQKHAGRAKERILQNLGKADKTQDELFDEYLNNFNKQQNAAIKLNKEIKHYMSCIKEMQAANKGLFETLVSVYDPDWLGHEQLYVRSQHIDMVWNDYSHKLNDQIMIPLQSYLNQFPDVKEKIGKRGRKLVDYDRQRHNYEALLNNTKKKDDVKVSKCKEQLDEAKKMYEILNNELHDDLPALYDNRIPFMVSNLQTLFTAENVFHYEVSKVYAQLVDMMEKLALENQKGTYMMKKPDSPPQKRSSDRTYEEIDMKKHNQPDGVPEISTNGETISQSPSSPKKSIEIEDSPPTRVVSTSDSSMHDSTTTSTTTTTTTTTSTKGTTSTSDTTDTPTGDCVSKPPETLPSGSTEEVKTDKVDEVHAENVDDKIDKERSPASSIEAPSKPGSNETSRRVEELYDIPVGATTTDLPPGVLYRVKANYKYVCEDQDELEFEPGEIIEVVEFDEPDEQETGWLMGVREKTGQKGLFPANFTRPI